MTDLEKIADLGLYVIIWRDHYKVGRHAYAISIDEAGSSPSAEQKSFCEWFCTPELAAEIYIANSQDH